MNEAPNDKSDMDAPCDASATARQVEGYAADLLVFDIETAHCDAEYLAHLAETWKPQTRWKESTAMRKRDEAIAGFAARSALSDGAQIICLGAKTQAEQIVFTWMPEQDKALHLEGASIVRFADEHDMLASFFEWVYAVCDCETILGGHNILKFDLPKIRNRAIRIGIKTPHALINLHQPCLDTMKEIRRYSCELSGDQFPGIVDVCRVLGLPCHKNLISGSDVPDLYDDGEYNTILTYNTMDVAIEYMAARTILDQYR